VAADADSSWNSQLAKVKLSGGSDADRRKFYTALYHTMFAPALFSDCGRPDEYTIFSLWDTYRAAHPLSTLIHPQLQPAYARTFINIFNKQGKLPVWHLHGNETDCMIGNPGVIVLADLLLKGYVADTLAAYEAMKASCMLDERSLAALKQYGYIPYDSPGGDESVAKGLEYAVADDAVARVAERLGMTDDARYFGERGQAYKRYFDSTTGFMRGRDIKGDFRPEPFDPFSASHRANDYCEGNGWQYIWMVPQDPNGLIELFGSTENFVTKLDSLFVVEGSLGESASPDISGLIGQYAHGNEPGHHTVYLYNYAGQSEKAAPLLRRIMNEMYTTEPDGLCGNEDVGQMSAWFVLSAMGIYQVEPAGGAFVFGSPLFDSASIEVGDGRTFEIRANGNSPENIYIQSARLNGKPYDKDYIDFETIRRGGVLEFEMGPQPAGKASE
jgi:predicted alpha-1,2-mannosidase